MSLWGKHKAFKLATWAQVNQLEQLWVEGREAEVASKCQDALDEVLEEAGKTGWAALSDEALAISVILCIIGNDPSGADALLASSETIEDYLTGEPNLERWANLLITRRAWRLQALSGNREIPLVADLAVQNLWKGTGDVTAAGESVSKCASGTMWDQDRNFVASYLANLFQTSAVLENWTDEQKIAAYQRTWQLFQWFIAWGSFTEFTAALQALEAEE
jgi:hypothetical protein